jgi:Mg-chelatase subunit ChlD
MRFLRPDLLSWWMVIPALVASCAVHARLVRAFRRSTVLPDLKASASGHAPDDAAALGSERRRARRAVEGPLSRRSTWRRDAAVLTASISATSAIVFALLRPQLLIAARVPDYERQDLVIMLDRSVSMHARDIRPSRFARATLELRTLVRQKPEGIDRIGLVGFAESALVLSYLTADVESVLFYLDWLDEESPVLFGTNIGAALKSARDVADKDDRPSRKRFLLVSDGEDHGTELDAALDAFRREGRRVDCIGIGTDRPVPIPLRSSDAREPGEPREPRQPREPVQYLLDDAGRRVTTTFEEATLVRVATATGGRYVRSATGSELARAIPELVKGDRRIVGWRTSTEYRDLYPLAVAVAAVATLALCLLI